MIRRLIQMVFLFLAFLTVTWFLLYILPGDAVALKYAGNPNIPPEAREVALQRLGLDKPVLIQFRDYMVNFFQGDLGVSFNQYPRPVTEIIGERLPRTLVLFLAALVTYYWAGFLAGKYLAWRRGSRGEMLITVSGVGLYSLFLPFFALMMIWLFSVQLDLLPISKFLDPEKWRDAPFMANEVFMRLFWVTLTAAIAMFAASFAALRTNNRRLERTLRWGGIALAALWFLFYWFGTPSGQDMRVYAGDIGYHMVLPVLVLTLINFGGVMLLTRSSMLETLREDYILTARAKGLPEGVVRDRHAARTALLPVVTSLVLAVATVIDGGVITEAVFSWPGMGEILISSVISEDIPLAVGAFSFIGIMALIGHFVVDVLYGVLDPRIRVTEHG
ncbi:MAG: ABC transporter permease [bacterium]|nr:ABC transporter permease [Acidimicrobiia bacterium]MCY4649332.1 ABC transporter permease [bacterium]